MTMLLGMDAAKMLGKAIDEKARKVLDSEHAIRSVVEMTPPRWLAFYGLEYWHCPHCRRPWRYNITLQRWECRCGRVA